jgi:hypothetical protein
MSWRAGIGGVEEGGCPGAGRRLDKRCGVKPGEVKLGRSVGGRDGDASHIFWNM